MTHIRLVCVRIFCFCHWTVYREPATMNSKVPSHTCEVADERASSSTTSAGIKLFLEIQEVQMFGRGGREAPSKNKY